MVIHKPIILVPAGNDFCITRNPRGKSKIMFFPPYENTPPDARKKLRKIREGEHPLHRVKSGEEFPSYCWGNLCIYDGVHLRDRSQETNLQG